MKWLEIAHAEMGVTEDKTAASNKRILQYAKAAGYTPAKGDDDPWCGNFMAFVMKQAGFTRPSQPWRARSWAEWGTATKPQRGAVAVVARGSSAKTGHVFLIDRVAGEWVYGLGGNQNDSVSIDKFRVDRLEACRWPPGAAAPTVEKLKVATKTATQSRTVTGVLMAALGTVVQYMEHGVKVLTDAASSVTEWAPIESLLYGLGANAKTVGLCMAATGLTLALWRRVDAGVKGREG